MTGVINVNTINDYLRETALLNYSDGSIQSLLTERMWDECEPFHQIERIYRFVRDEILFGYNSKDAIPASEVLTEGYGQCNTKGILFMALLRAVGIPCQIHGFTIDKRLQKGAMSGLVYSLSPESILHSWVEVLFEGHWYELEGFILDMEYLRAVQNRFQDCDGFFMGYGIAVKNLRDPVIDWDRNNTYIQKEGINRDLGIFVDPDDLFLKHSQDLSGLKDFLFQKLGRHLMNRQIERIRSEL